MVHLRSIHREAVKFPLSKERGPHDDDALQESGGDVHSDFWVRSEFMPGIEQYLPD